MNNGSSVLSSVVDSNEVRIFPSVITTSSSDSSLWRSFQLEHSCTPYVPAVILLVLYTEGRLKVSLCCWLQLTLDLFFNRNPLTCPLTSNLCVAWKADDNGDDDDVAATWGIMTENNSTNSSGCLQAGGAGLIASVGSEKTPGPASLTAATRNSYGLPSTRFRMVHSVPLMSSGLTLAAKS